MDNGLTERHKRFAEAVALRGLPYYRAYKEAGFESSGHGAYANASRLAQDPDVAALIEELSSMRKDDKERLRALVVKFHEDVIATPVDEVDAKHYLAQEVEESGNKIRVKMPSKTASAKELAALAGLNEPEKVEHSGKIEFEIPDTTGLEDIG